MPQPVKRMSESESRAAMKEMSRSRPKKSKGLEFSEERLAQQRALMASHSYSTDGNADDTAAQLEILCRSSRAEETETFNAPLQAPVLKEGDAYDTSAQLTTGVPSASPEEKVTDGPIFTLEGLLAASKPEDDELDSLFGEDVLPESSKYGDLILENPDDVPAAERRCAGLPPLTIGGDATEIGADDFSDHFEEDMMAAFAGSDSGSEDAFSHAETEDDAAEEPTMVSWEDMAAENQQPVHDDSESIISEEP